MSTKLSGEEFKKKVFDFGSRTEWHFEGEKPALIEFYADWCPPCKVVAPILEELGRDYAGQVDVYQVNTDEEQELAAVFGISSIPVLMFVPQKGEPRMSVGAVPKAQILKAMKDVMAVG